MKIDYHLHLEEGPYNAQWMARTVEALVTMDESISPDSTLPEMEKIATLFYNRLQHGAFHEQWLDYYLQRAITLNMKEVGIVDHLYRFHETKDYFERFLELSEETEIGQVQRKWLSSVMTTSMKDFYNFISEAKEKWAQHGIQLKVGIECDYFVGGETQLQELISPYEWDYVIGSVHFVDGWGFDNPTLQHVFDRYDLKELYAQFFTIVIQMIESKRFDFVAHLDNLKVFNHRVHDEDFMLGWYQKVANALKQADVATEINGGLHYRYPVKESCPAPAFLRMLAEHHIPLTISSDAHYPQHLGMLLEEHMAQLKALNVKEVATFTKRKRVMQVLD